MRVLLPTLFLFTLAFAGCLTSGGDGADDPDATTVSATSTTGAGTGTTSSTGTTTSGGDSTPDEARTLNFTADVVNGTAPLVVNFTLNATGNVASWALGFGDGQTTNGTTLPALVNHTYEIGGNFSANLTVTYADGETRSAGLNFTIAVPAGASAPDVLHFKFSDSLGCAGDAGADKCISFTAGPDAAISGIDGYWQALDERYWGLSFTSTVDQLQPAVADSDCAFTDADHTIIGTANNSDKPCTGTVPEGTAFIFLYPYGLPALSQTLTFTV